MHTLAIITLVLVVWFLAGCIVAAGYAWYRHGNPTIFGERK